MRQSPSAPHVDFGDMADAQFPVTKPTRVIDRVLSQLQSASMDGLIGRILTEIEERKDEMKMTGQISFRLVLPLPRNRFLILIINDLHIHFLHLH